MGLLNHLLPRRATRPPSNIAHAAPLTHVCCVPLDQAALCTRCHLLQRATARMWCRVCGQGHMITLTAWAELQPQRALVPTHAECAAALADNAGLYLTMPEKPGPEAA